MQSGASGRASGLAGRRERRSGDGDGPWGCSCHVRTRRRQPERASNTPAGRFCAVPGGTTGGARQVLGHGTHRRPMAETLRSRGEARSAGGGKGHERRPRARKKATARAQRNGGGKRADILRDAERHGTSWHSPPGRRARGHRATERRTAPRASAPEPRYTIGGIRESGTPSVAQPACSLLTQCAAMQCAPGSLGDQPLPVPSDSILILAAIGASKPWRQGQGAAQWTDSQPSSSALDAKHGSLRSLPRFRTRREHVAGCLKPPRNDGTSAGPLKKYRR